MERGAGFVAVLLIAAILLGVIYQTPRAAEMTQAVSPPQKISDTDQDGIPDYLDICPGRNNIGGDDRDGDRLRDACDLAPDG